VTARRPVKQWTAPRTAWGDPDLQGTWTSNGVAGIPIERPTEFGTREFLTDEEFAKRQENDRIGALDEVVPGRPRGIGGPSHWYEWYAKTSRRTSLFVDPPDGRVPWTAEARRQDRRLVALGRFETLAPPRFGEFQSWEDADLWERCISRGLPSAMIPNAYDNAYLILQGPGYVAIRYEMLDLRVIPVDGRAHLSGKIPQWFGDSRGRWEGDTLVVDVTNFPDKTYAGNPTGSALHVTERFRRVDANTMEYRATIEHPALFTRPVTLDIPLSKNDAYRLFEYACHEGNYTMIGLMNIARGAKNP
jgi:hypothetical protein